LNVANVRAATRGSVLARAVLTALHDGPQQYGNDDDNDNNNYDEHVTVFGGHDGDHDTLGTVFGVRWKLNARYRYLRSS
jgi:hypothetical protein